MTNKINTSVEAGGQFAVANKVVGREPHSTVDENGHVTAEARAAIVGREVVAPPAYPFGLGFSGK
jgi:hypothetical protein